MLETYLHFYSYRPLYAGEGIESRKHCLKRGSIYGDWLKKHGDEHVCILQVGSHSNKVSSLINEQGLIKWLGRKCSGDGPLMNTLSYGDLGCSQSIPIEIETERRKKISESNIGDVERYAKISRAVSTHKLKKWKDEYSDLGKEVQSLWKRSHGVKSPLERFKGGKNKGWGYKSLCLCLGDFPSSILKRLIDGEDYGGSEEFVSDEQLAVHLQVLNKEHLRIREKASKSLKGKTIATTSITCPHCGKSGRPCNMKRYHFDKCSYLQREV